MDNSAKYKQHQSTGLPGNPAQALAIVPWW